MSESLFNMKKVTQAQLFFKEFCKFFKNTYLVSNICEQLPLNFLLKRYHKSFCGKYFSIEILYRICDRRVFFKEIPISLKPVTSLHWSEVLHCMYFPVSFAELLKRSILYKTCELHLINLRVFRRATCSTQEESKQKEQTNRVNCSN